jgi:excisionase family DNA binding protein
MKGNDYATLRDRYPDLLSLDELSRICKIAKRSAHYLVANGIIPAIDTGRQTWRYKISIEDVITYLRRREKVGSMIPPGTATSRCRKRLSKPISNRKSFAQLVEPGQEREVAEYFKYIFDGHDEVLTTVDIAEMTGLDRSTVMKLAKSGQIKSIQDKPKYLIPKKYLLEFVVTPRFLEARTNSEFFLKIIGGFEIWKTVKSSR